MWDLFKFQYYRRGRAAAESESEASEASENEDDSTNNQKLAEVFRLTEERKTFLVSKICLFGSESGRKAGKQERNFLSCHIDDTSALLIVKYLSSKRPFFNSFDVYLKAIIGVLTEQSIQVNSYLISIKI